MNPIRSECSLRDMLRNNHLAGAPHPAQPLNYCSSLWARPLWTFHINGLIQHVVFVPDFFHSHNVFKVHLRCSMDHTLRLNNVPLNVSNDFLVHSFLGNSGLIETQSTSEPLAASPFHAHMAAIIPRALAKTVVPGLLYFSLSCPTPLSLSSA